MQTDTSFEAPTIGGLDDLNSEQLEAWLGGELKCQMQHGREGCTVEVVARAVSCGTSLNVCENGRRWHVQKMQGNWKCAECKRRARDCWRVIPI